MRAEGTWVDDAKPVPTSKVGWDEGPAWACGGSPSAGEWLRKSNRVLKSSNTVDITVERLAGTAEGTAEGVTEGATEETRGETKGEEETKGETPDAQLTGPGPATLGWVP